MNQLGRRPGRAPLPWVAGRSSVALTGALLVGLNLGPNLFVTGSLAVYLWWRAARRAGAQPALRGYLSAGVPAALRASLAALAAIALTARS